MLLQDAPDESDEAVTPLTSDVGDEVVVQELVRLKYFFSVVSCSGMYALGSGLESGCIPCKAIALPRRQYGIAVDMFLFEL